MVIDKKRLAEILSDGIKKSNKGQFIPEMLLKVFVERLVSFCLTDKWFSTDPLAQWLIGEYDFLPDEITELIKGIKEQLSSDAGIEVLFPGQALPPEAKRKPPEKEAEIELEEDREEMDKWGGEWKPDEAEEDEKLSLVDADTATPSMMVQEEEEEEEFIEMASEEELKPKRAEPSSIAEALKAKDGIIVRDIPGKVVEKAREEKKVEALGTTTTQKTAPVAKARQTSRPRPVKPKAQAPVPTPPALSVAEASAILFALSGGGPKVDEIIGTIAKEGVLTGDFEKKAFSDPKDNLPQTLALRNALCWQLILEFDYSQYTGLRKIGGLILSEAVKQSKGLLDKSGAELKSLEEARRLAAQKMDGAEIEAIASLQNRVNETKKKLTEIVSALSYIPASTTCPPAPQKIEIPVVPEKKQARERPETEKEKERKNYFKVALAVAIMVAVLAGAGLYIKSFFKGGTNISLDPNEYKSILVMKEAKISGTSFVGIVETAYWKSLSKEERASRAQQLFEKVRGEQINGVLLLSATGKRLAVIQPGYTNIYQ